MRILAIDPGNTESGWVIIDTTNYKPLLFGKTENNELLSDLGVTLNKLRWDQVVIEWIQSYGMPVGKEVFETCLWVGRYLQVLTERGTPPTLTSRGTVKTHHCHSGKAKDSNVTQALVDRFTPGQPNRGKGTKTNPGWFHGFHADIWAAYALAVQHADTQHRPPNTPPETDRLPSGDQDDPKQALAEYDASVARLKARLAAIPPDPHRPVDTLLDGDMTLPKPDGLYRGLFPTVVDVALPEPGRRHPRTADAVDAYVAESEITLFPKAPTEAEWNERIKATR